MKPPNVQLYERITGERLAPSLADGEVPAPSVERMERYHAFMAMLATPAFALTMEFFRERAFSAVVAKKSEFATDAQLRAAKAVHEVVTEQGHAMVAFIEETEQMLKNRQEWAKREEERGGAPPAAPETNL